MILGFMVLVYKVLRFSIYGFRIQSFRFYGLVCQGLVFRVLLFRDKGVIIQGVEDLRFKVLWNYWFRDQVLCFSDYVSAFMFRRFSILMFIIQGLGFLGFCVLRLLFRLLRCAVCIFGFRFYVLRFMVQILQFNVYGSGFWHLGCQG